MKCYFVGAEDYGPYCATLAEAKALARHHAKDNYHDVTVDLVEIDTDKANVLRLANVQGGFMRTVTEAVYVAKARRKREDD